MKTFKGFHLGFSPKQLSCMEVQRPFTRSSGEVEAVTMSQAHWDALAWLVNIRGYRIGSVREGVDHVVGNYSLSQALTWWVEVAYAEVRQPDEDGCAERA